MVSIHYMFGRSGELSAKNGVWEMFPNPLHRGTRALGQELPRFSWPEFGAQQETEASQLAMAELVKLRQRYMKEGIVTLHGRYESTQSVEKQMEQVAQGLREVVVIDNGGCTFGFTKDDLQNIPWGMVPAIGTGRLWVGGGNQLPLVPGRHKSNDYYMAYRPQKEA